MSDLKISELEELTSYALPNDKLAIVNEGVTKQVSVENLFGDTGWVDLILKTGFPHIDIENKPQYRVIGSVVYLRGLLTIPAVGKTTSVDSNFIETTSLGGLYYRANTGHVNLPKIAAPETTLAFPNKTMVRKYMAINGVVSSNVSIVTNNSFFILNDGTFLFSGIFDVEDVPTGNDSIGAHPLRTLSTVIGVNNQFPDYAKFNVGNVSHNFAIQIPAHSTKLKASENINTTNIDKIGGFAIELDGISFLTENTGFRPYWDNFNHRS